MFLLEENLDIFINCDSAKLADVQDHVSMMDLLKMAKAINAQRSRQQIGTTAERQRNGDGTLQT